jgi:Helix-turn-helix domain
MEKSNIYRPKAGSGRARALTLSQRKGGVSQAEALADADGWRLADQIYALKSKGHIFRTVYEGKSRCARYIWTGYCPGCAAQTSETPHIGDEAAGGPPVWEVRGAGV